MYKIHIKLLARQLVWQSKQCVPNFRLTIFASAERMEYMCYNVTPA